MHKERTMRYLALFSLVVIMSVGCATGSSSTGQDSKLTLTGTTPQDWKAVKVPSTQIIFAIPSSWETIDEKAGIIGFRPSSDTQGLGYVTLVEEIPTSRLSLARLMENDPIVADVLKATYASLIGEGVSDKLPLYWSSYGRSAPEHYVGGIVTDEGTIIITGFSMDLTTLESFASTISYDAKPILFD